MLNLTGVFIKYGDRELFKRVNATIKNGERVGLIGRNGAGKTTLLKLITGEISPHEGKLEITKGMSIGHLKQVLDFNNTHTVMQEALLAFEEYWEIQRSIDKYNKQLETRTDYESDAYANIIQNITDLSESLGMFDADSPEAQASKILKGLGFKDNELHNPLSTFSGGWLMRVEMAKLLLQHPDILLLDEPTNHLDIESIIWLEQYLQSYNGIIILISHDKMFLDNVTNRTIEIELGRLMDIKGNYTKFLTEKVLQSKITQSAFENQQREIQHKEKLIEKFRAKANKAKLAQSLIKQLDKMDKVEVLSEDTKVMNIRFPEPPRSGRDVVKMEGLSKSYGEKEVLQNVDLLIERGDRVAFVGQNGQGKSTLAKIITKHLDVTSGEINLTPTVEIGYYAQNNHETLDGNTTLYDTLYHHTPPELKTRVRAILGSFLFSGDDIDKKVKVLSGGERARLAMACLVVNPVNLLVLDEPTNHLDILSKQTLKESLADYKGTLIVVSHDRDFLADMTNKTYEFTNHTIKEYLGDVNYFLEKKAMEDFREVELDYKKKSKKSESKVQNNQEVPVTNNPSGISAAEEKEVKRAIQNVERAIGQLEKEIKELELKMGAEGFYESADSQKTLDKYNQQKEKLTTKETEWAGLIEKLEA